MNPRQVSLRIFRRKRAGCNCGVFMLIKREGERGVFFRLKINERKAMVPEVGCVQVSV